MAFTEYSEYDGLGLAELVRRGEVSPPELVEAAIERIERHNPVLNAVVYKAYDEARARVARGAARRRVPRRAVPGQGPAHAGRRHADDRRQRVHARRSVDARTASS